MEKERKLNMTDKILLGKINYFEQSNHPTPNQTWFAQEMGITRDGLYKIVRRLKDAGYLEQGHKLKLTRKMW